MKETLVPTCVTGVSSLERSDEGVKSNTVKLLSMCMCVATLDDM